MFFTLNEEYALEYIEDSFYNTWSHCMQSLVILNSSQFHRVMMAVWLTGSYIVMTREPSFSYSLLQQLRLKLFYLPHFDSSRCVFLSIDLLFPCLNVFHLDFLQVLPVNFMGLHSYYCWSCHFWNQWSTIFYRVDLYLSRELEESVAFHFSTISYPNNDSVMLLD